MTFSIVCCSVVPPLKRTPETDKSIYIQVNERIKKKNSHAGVSVSFHHDLYQMGVIPLCLDDYRTCFESFMLMILVILVQLNKYFSIYGKSRLICSFLL